MEIPVETIINEYQSQVLRLTDELVYARSQLAVFTKKLEEVEGNNGD